MNIKTENVLLLTPQLVVNVLELFLINSLFQKMSTILIQKMETIYQLYMKEIVFNNVQLTGVFYTNTDKIGNQSIKDSQLYVTHVE